MAKPKKTEETTETKPYMEPALSFDDKHKNAFIKHVEENEPELKAVGYARIPGTNDYAAYVITFKGNQISKMVVDEPNISRIAEDQAKGMFVAEIVDKTEEF